MKLLAAILLFVAILAGCEHEHVVVNNEDEAVEVSDYPPMSVSYRSDGIYVFYHESFYHGPYGNETKYYEDGRHIQ